MEYSCKCFVNYFNDIIAMVENHKKSVNGWLNVYKPRGISSAKAVHIIKRIFKGNKIGHTGTLDLEAEGVLPIAIGQATKLVRVLMDAKKTYVFTIKFGAKTDTADLSGKILERTNYIPNENECTEICKKFIGKIKQSPPIYSAIKINGKRSYKLALQSIAVDIPARIVQIYKLKLLQYNIHEGSVTYEVECSKGTYIRSLAEDISLCLKSLGFVIELQRVKVGMFTEIDVVKVLDYVNMDCNVALEQLQCQLLKMENVLGDIPVLDVCEQKKQKIIFGQIVEFVEDAVQGISESDLIWIKHDNKIVAIGHISDNRFHSSRVFI